MRDFRFYPLRGFVFGTGSFVEEIPRFYEGRDRGVWFSGQETRRLWPGPLYRVSMDYFFIGDPELLTAFRFVGIDGVSVRGPDDTRAAFLKITRNWDETAGVFLPGAETCRVLILTEEAADWLGDDLTQWQLSGHYPLVVEIPGTMGRLEGRKTLVDSIREAIGIHV